MRILSLLSAVLLVNALLLAPQWIAWRSLGSQWLALEAPLIVGLCALMPRRGWGAATAVAGATGIMLVACLVIVGNEATHQVLARPLNLYLDVHLVSAVGHLLIGTFGSVAAVAIMLVGLAVATGVASLLAVLLSRTRAPRSGLAARTAGLALVAAAGVMMVFKSASGAEHELLRRTATPAVTVMTQQVQHLGRMLDERRLFSTELAGRPANYDELPGLLKRLHGRDVVLGFIESYGHVAANDPRYAPVLRPRLAELERRLAAAGLHLATGSLIAPTQGGQSWFSHGSLLSGAWIDNQLRYDLLLASGRNTLIDDFRQAGYRTVALMPAITRAWPEGDRLGYEWILTRPDIDYAGPPLNWVTMPDQFTWSYFEHRVRNAPAGDPRPVFAEITLISSHAPWTPILQVIDDWDRIDNGAIFTRWQNAGERPVDLWRDHDRVREHFALSVDYAVAAMTSYAERYVDDGFLLIVLGDHQPAPLITGDDTNRAVPVHVISGDPGLVDPFTAWGFASGAFPDPAAEVRRMDAFRDWFVPTFSGPEAPVHPDFQSRNE